MNATTVPADDDAQKGAFRQAMAWLHTWTGLIVGWVLFFIFVTGTVGYFASEIDRWMKPETPLRSASVTPEKALALAQARLRERAPKADSWTITLPGGRSSPHLLISWRDPPKPGENGFGRGGPGGRGDRSFAGRGPGGPGERAAPGGRGGRPERMGAGGRESRGERAGPGGRGGPGRSGPGGGGGRGGFNPFGGEREILDVVTGKPVVSPAARETGGGHFLYRMHWQLHYLPRDIGMLIVEICAMIMFIAILSGIVAHKRIFKDFFTFRPGKGQRSWLDFHTLASVTSLPFFLMITFSGLLYFMTMFLPAPTALLTERPQMDRSFFMQGPDLKRSSSAPQASLNDIYAQAATVLGAERIERISIDLPGDAKSRITVSPPQTGN